jgi:anti-anti-sigma factor
MGSTGTPTRRSRVTMFADRRTVITVCGALDVTTTPDLERMVADNLDGDTGVLVLDLSAVTAFDAAALAVLGRLQEVCAARTVALRVTPSDTVLDAVLATPLHFVIE